MTTTLANLLDPMLRMAGITARPMMTAPTDAYAELIPMVNRMLSSYSLDGHRIYTADINQFNLTSGKKIYTIGPGGELDCPRPIYIKEANVLLPTTPVVRWRLAILSDDEWAQISIQDLPGAPPVAIYYDGGMDANGRGNLYLWFQPPPSYTLELYTWLALKSNFTAVTDAVVLPPGYEEMIVTNGAVRAAALYPREAAMSPDVRELARQALQQVIISNSSSPTQLVEPGFDGEKTYGEYRGWLDGPFRP